MVPIRLKKWMAGDAPVADIAVDWNALVSVRAEANTVRELARAAVVGEGAAAVRSAALTLARDLPRDIRLALPVSQLLVKRLTLPAATEENLRDVLGFDMDRQTPFSAAQVYYGGRVLSRDTTHDRIDVELTVAPKHVADPWLQGLREAGFYVQSMVASNALSPNVQAVELLPLEARPKGRLNGVQQANIVLLALALLLGLAAVFIPIWQKRQAVIALAPLADKARSEFEATQKIEAQYKRLAEEQNFLIGKKHATTPTVMILDELAKIFIDTTWLQSFDLKNTNKAREISLTGEAASASKVVEALEQSSLLQNAKQPNATRGSQPSLERFTVATEVKPRALPTPLPAGLDAVGSAPVAAAPAAVAVSAPASAPALAANGAAAPAAGVATVTPINAPIVPPKSGAVVAPPSAVAITTNARTGAAPVAGAPPAIQPALQPTPQPTLQPTSPPATPSVPATPAPMPTSKPQLVTPAPPVSIATPLPAAPTATPIPGKLP